MEGEHDFAEALSAAIRSRGLSLGNLQDRLRAAGIPISRATLSYWQSGRSQPEKPQSLVALGVLEQVLQVPPGDLRRLLGPPRARGRRIDRTVNVNVRQGMDPVGGLVQSALSDLGLIEDDRNLTRIALMDRMFLDSRGVERYVVCRQVLRAEADGVSRFPVVFRHYTDESSLGQVKVIYNCEFSEVVEFPDRNLTVTALSFSTPLRRGDSLVIEYMIEGPPAISSPVLERSFITPVQVSTLELVFDPQYLPRRQYAYRKDRFDSEEQVVRELRLQGNLVHGVFLDQPPGLVGVAWEW